MESMDILIISNITLCGVFVEGCDIQEGFQVILIAPGGWHKGVFLLEMLKIGEAMDSTVEHHHPGVLQATQICMNSGITFIEYGNIIRKMCFHNVLCEIASYLLPGMWSHSPDDFHEIAVWIIMVPQQTPWVEGFI